MQGFYLPKPVGFQDKDSSREHSTAARTYLHPQFAPARAFALYVETRAPTRRSADYVCGGDALLRRRMQA